MTKRRLILSSSRREGKCSRQLAGLTLASLAGILLLRESFTWRYAAGMAFAFVGIYLIITR